MIVNLNQTHFLSILKKIIVCIYQDIPEVFSLKMQCILISVAKGPE